MKETKETLTTSEMKNISSKKCLDQKFAREKRVFEYMLGKLEQKDLLNELGDDFNKVLAFYSKESRGASTTAFRWASIVGMSAIDVFAKFDKSVKDCNKNGYILDENQVYVARP